MKSRISFFNAGFFKSNVKRFWPLWAVYFAALFLAVPIQAVLADGDTAVLLGTLADLCAVPAVVSNFLMGILTAMAVFSFMYNTRTVGMISSLPVRREAVFTSAFLSGLVPVLAINVIIALLTFLSGMRDNTVIVLKSVLVWLGVFSMQFFIFYGIAVITAMMTGMLIGLPILYGVFNFLVPGVEMLLSLVVQLFTFGLVDFGTPFTLFFSPAAFLAAFCTHIQTPWRNGSGDYVISALKYEYFGTLAIYCLAAVLLVFIALLMFRKRETERTGDVIAVKSLRPVFKYGVTVCFSLGIGLLLYAIFGEFGSENGSALLISVTMIIGAFIGYYASDMLLSKSFHVFRGNWKGFLIVAVLCIVFVVCCDLDVFGIESYVPDGDDIQMITLSSYDAEYETESEFEPILELHKNIIEDKDKYLAEGGEWYCDVQYCNIDYCLKSGRVISRSYALSYIDDSDRNIEAMNAILNCADVVLDRYTPEHAMTAQSISYASVFWNQWSENYESEICEQLDLTSEQLLDVYNNAVVPDIKNGGYRTDREFIENIDINISFTVNYDEYYTIRVDPNEPLTVQWIRDNLGWDIYSTVK